MIKNVRLSVVIPVYNSERTLRTCINSLLNQSLKPWEIIIVDAGSQDGTKQIAEEFTRDNSIIRYYDVGLRGRGISSQKNYGARLATGDYLIFVDSDWYLDLQAVEMLAKLAADGTLCGVTATGKRKVDEELSYITRCREVLWSSSSAQSYLNHTPHKSDSPRGNPCFIRREVFISLGGFDTKLLALEDADLYVRCVFSGIHPRDAADLGIHDQVITLKTIITRRIRSAYATWAFEEKWGRTAWGRRAKIKLKKRHNIVLRWLKGIMGVARREPMLLPGALLISIIDGMSSIIAKLLWKFAP